MFKPAAGLGEIDSKQPSVIQVSSVRDRTGGVGGMWRESKNALTAKQ